MQIALLLVLTACPQAAPYCPQAAPWKRSVAEVQVEAIVRTPAATCKQSLQVQTGRWVTVRRGRFRTQTVWQPNAKTAPAPVTASEGCKTPPTVTTDASIGSGAGSKTGGT